MKLILFILFLFLITFNLHIFKIYKNDEFNKFNKKIKFKSGNENFLNKKYKIPKVIYKSGKENPNEISSALRKLFVETLILNKDFKIEYYSDINCRNFIKNNFTKDVLWAYDYLKPGSYKADLFRYCILYKKGGIWSDLTDKILVDLTKYIDFDSERIVLVQDLLHKNLPGIQIAFMAARPKQSIFLKAINGIVSNCKNKYYGKTFLDVTGPRFFFRIVRDNEPKLFDYLKIRFDGNYYYISKKKIVKFKSQRIFLNTYLKRNNKNHYSKLWKERKIFNESNHQY
jgi:mannosyltransferase OCH1-like enzyme